MGSKEQMLVKSCIVILMPLFKIMGSGAVLLAQLCSRLNRPCPAMEMRYPAIEVSLSPAPAVSGVCAAVAIATPDIAKPLGQLPCVLCHMTSPE